MDNKIKRHVGEHDDSNPLKHPCSMTNDVGVVPQ